jgi:hypothetical protein
MPDRAQSRRLVIRMPVSLHHQVGLAAASEGVSVNQFVCALLASGVGWRSQPSETPPRSYPKTNEEAVNDMWAKILGS